MMPGQTSDNPLRISVEDLHDRLEAGEPATVFDVRNPNDWDRSNWKIPGALRPLQGEIALDPRWPRTRLEVLPMETDQSRVIAIEGECDCHTVHLAKVHHRDFPHMHAEAVTPTIAAAYLAEQLTRVLDTAPDPVNRGRSRRPSTTFDTSSSPMTS